MLLAAKPWVAPAVEFMLLRYHTAHNETSVVLVMFNLLQGGGAPCTKPW